MLKLSSLASRSVVVRNNVRSRHSRRVSLQGVTPASATFNVLGTGGRTFRSRHLNSAYPWALAPEDVSKLSASQNGRLPIHRIGVSSCPFLGIPKATERAQPATQEISDESNSLSTHFPDRLFLFRSRPRYAPAICNRHHHSPKLWPRQKSGDDLRAHHSHPPAEEHSRRRRRHARR